jgi:hypothetical protein
MEQKQQQHYSERLHRNFEDGDTVYSVEVREIIRQNSGRDRPVPSTALSEMASTRNLWREHVGANVVMYRYAEIKHLKMLSKRGRAFSDNPSPGALRKRKHDAARRGSAGRGAIG